MTTSLFHGLLVVDKPAGLTSRDVVDRTQGWFPRGTRIGHTGTLDPLATGVLVLTVGSATRLSEYVQRMDKTYRTTIRLGATSDTDDGEGTITPVSVVQMPDQTAVERVLQEFVGEIDQVPPAYSAAKVDGRRAYSLARRGSEVALKSRRIQVHAIDVLAYEYPRLELEVRCGKGTYIRSLARDIGARLGCGAYVESLRRTRIGQFRVEDALNIDVDATTAADRLLPLAAAVAELPAVRLSADAIARLRNGQRLEIADRESTADELGNSEIAAVLDEAGHLVGVVNIDRTSQQLVPTKMFSQADAQSHSSPARG